MIISSHLLVFFLCVHTSVNLPTKVLDKRKRNELWLRRSNENLPSTRGTKLKSSEGSRRSSISKTTPSTTIGSSFKRTRKKHSAHTDTKQPSSQPTPTVTPANPIAHASNARLPITPLHVLSVVPIKPMTSSHEGSVRSDPDLPEEPGCICCCHKTEIHEPVLPNQPIEKVPSLGEMIAPLKDAKCGDCCTWKCGKCNVTICKTKPTEVNSEQCVHSLLPPKNSSINPVVKLATCPMQCAQESCATKCPPETPPSTVYTNTDTTCPLNPTYPSNNAEYFPPCIIRCNNNYLGNNLEYGGETNGEGNNFQYESVEGRQPTTRKVSSIPPLASMKEITETQRADVGYNPIQPMPTQPALGPEDIIVHHILVAQQYITQNPPDYIFDGYPT